MTVGDGCDVCKMGQTPAAEKTSWDMEMGVVVNEGMKNGIKMTLH